MNTQVNFPLSPAACFDALKPTLQEVMKTICMAPVENQANQTALHVLVCAYFFAAACAALKESSPELKDASLPELAQQVATLITSVTQEVHKKSVH